MDAKSDAPFGPGEACTEVGADQDDDGKPGPGDAPEGAGVFVYGVAGGLFVWFCCASVGYLSRAFT